VESHPDRPARRFSARVAARSFSALEVSMATVHPEADSSLEVCVPKAKTKTKTKEGPVKNDTSEPNWPPPSAEDTHIENGNGEFHFPGPVYRYQNGGTAVLTAGIIGGIVTNCWGFLPAWAGFFAGAVPTFLMAALYYYTHDAGCRNLST
jgi:hypothetical protein